MAEETQDKKPRKLSLRNVSFKKLNRKYDFLMRHDESKKEILGFKLNLLNLILVIIGLALLLIIITTFIIAFTPLREYIPGYTDTSLNRKVYQLNLRADSLANELRKKDIYFENLQKVILGYDFAADSCHEEINIYEPLPSSVTENIVLKKSSQDSLLRAEFEAESQYNIFGALPGGMSKTGMEVKNFFVPLDGVIIKPFAPNESHLGVDIVSNGEQVIKATLDGTVVFATWSLNKGYYIGIQHENGYFSTYGHNATLLKKEGDYVKAGEAIAILGGSGEKQAQEHLHFELWRNGIAINPTDYMMMDNNATKN